MSVLDVPDDLLRYPLGNAKLAKIEEGAQDGAHHHARTDRVIRRLAVSTVGPPDYLSHGQSASGKGEGTELGPVIPTALFVDGRGSSKVPRYH